MKKHSKSVQKCEQGSQTMKNQKHETTQVSRIILNFFPLKELWVAENIVNYVLK